MNGLGQSWGIFLLGLLLITCERLPSMTRWKLRHLGQQCTSSAYIERGTPPVDPLSSSPLSLTTGNSVLNKSNGHPRRELPPSRDRSGSQDCGSPPRFSGSRLLCRMGKRPRVCGKTTQFYNRQFGVPSSARSSSVFGSRSRSAASRTNTKR